MLEPLPLQHIGEQPLASASLSEVQHVLHRDYETRSKVSLKKVGIHQYAADPSTEVVFGAFAVDDGPVRVWRPGDPLLPEVIEAAHNVNWRVAAHNDPFESAIEHYNLAPRLNWPLVPIERHRCTMAMALAAGLPARLGMLADGLNLTNRKDRGGERLMHQMSKPRRVRKAEDPNGVYYFDDPDRLERWQSYMCQDVEVEREVYQECPPLPPTEQLLWQLNCIINERGFLFDRALAKAAKQIAAAAGPEIDAKLADITGGTVTGVNQIARIQNWLREQGYSLESLGKKAIEKQLLDLELPMPVQRVLELRAGGAQAAVKKLDALLARAGDDDRIRDEFCYHGAGTGRFSGQGVQVQNLKRPTIEKLDDAITVIRTGDYEHVRKLYSKPLAAIGDCTRSMIIAASGYKLIGGDFSSIESRILAWGAGEAWKLDSYRRYDATRDPRDEPYCITACKIFRVPDGTYTKASPERNVGKTCDLAFGYMGGLNAWRKFEPDRFTNIEVEKFKAEWRATHPNIVKFWYAVDRAAWAAVRDRGRVVTCGPVAFRSNGAFLQLKLPSGRKISYPQPRIRAKDERHQYVIFSDNADGQFKDCRFGAGAYGGLWVENIVSGIARDLLVEAMFRVEATGYRIVLTVHDEIMCEVPKNFGSEQEFIRLMTRKPAWALDLPIAAEAWSGPRYRK
jgi:DNA polymerase bacteriophage-type